jgi:hypothetical protein
MLLVGQSRQYLTVKMSAQQQSYFARHKSSVEVIRRLLALSNLSAWERSGPGLRFAAILLASGSVKA